MSNIKQTMNSKATEKKENNENLCPFTRKRVPSKDSTTQTPNWKLAKLESASSPSALTNEYLEEMGIGMLDSEESSSSAASAVALALTASTDENSNEAKPNLDAPMFAQQSKQLYRRMDSLLDATSDNACNSNIFVPNDTNSSTLVKTSTDQHAVNKLNINNNSKASFTFGMYPSELKSLLNSSDKFQAPTTASVSQGKKTAILGMGASSTITSIVQKNGNSGAKNSRSPLATVTCNSFLRNAKIQQQQLLQQQQQHGLLKQVSSENALLPPRPQSPQMLPSTSQQAALLEQQHHHHQQKLMQQMQLQQPQIKQPQLKQPEEQQYQPKLHHLNQQYKIAMQNEKAHLASQRDFFLYRRMISVGYNREGKDYFNTLSDEIILQIFKLLPKKTLLRCGYVCRRFNRCASDESLWTRLDLGQCTIKQGGMENIVKRGVVILRLAQAQLHHPIFEKQFLESEPNFEAKLQYLDLSMATVTKPSLKMLLSRCRQLKKLSLEHVPLNDDICNEIAKNTGIEILNLAMCTGLEAWSVRKMMESLQQLCSLNISWTNLSVDALTSLVTNISPSLIRLNVSGCRKTMFDSHVASLAKRCPQLIELDVSDCTGLTGNVIAIVSSFKMLEYLSLSRCYHIPASSYMPLRLMPSLAYLDIFGMLTETAMEVLEINFSNISINKFVNSSVARPTVGSRRTSIWGLRTRD